MLDLKSTSVEVRHTTTTELAKSMNDRYTAGFCADFICMRYLGTSIDELASIFDNANLTAGKGASIFDNANLSVSKGASIFDNANLSVSKGASIFDSTNLGVSKAASILENTNLSISKLDSIIGDANIGDDRASDIVYETAVATRDLSSASNIIGTAEILDDWQDNKLTTRDSEATTPIKISSPYVQDANTFRPSWTTESGSPSASGGVLVLTAGDTTAQGISTPTTFFVGTWEVDIQKQADGTTSGVDVIDWVSGGSKKYIIGWNYDGAYNLRDIVDTVNIISATHAEDTAWHTCKATRDSSSNWELFFDGVSDGTATDSTTTSIDEVWVYNYEDIEVHYDNLKIW